VKTVNATFTVTREGITTAYPLPKLAYARYVTLQIALIGALVQLTGFGTRRAAQLVEDVPATGRMPLRGTNDLTFSLVADHGAGASSFSASYAGISSMGADRSTALMMQAYNGAMAGDGD
jgi:hypothetical protein